MPADDDAYAYQLACTDMILVQFGFPGLKDGDGWCVCASWYARAVEAGKGCPIYLKSTHENTLKILPIETLKKFAIDLS